MEVADYTYTPLMVMVDDVTRFVNHSGLSHIGWHKGLSGNWSVPHLFEIVSHIDGIELRFILTLTPRLHSIFNNPKPSDSDEKYIAGLILTMLPEDMYRYEKLMMEGYKYMLIKNVRILAKITDKGVEYVATRS